MGGDKYLVCWDQRLMPRFISSPYMAYMAVFSSKIAQKLSEIVKSLSCAGRKPVSDSEARKKQREAHQALMKYFIHFRECEKLRQKASVLLVKYASLFSSTCIECELLKKMLLRHFDWDEHYDQVSKTLRQLEEAYEKFIKGPTKCSNTTLPAS